MPSRRRSFPFFFSFPFSGPGGPGARDGTDGARALHPRSLEARGRCTGSFCILLSGVLLFGASLCGATAGRSAQAAESATERADIHALRLDQIQLIGTHNSYHAGSRHLDAIAARYPALARLLDYRHAPLDIQLDHGIRQIELDLYADSEGGRFASPHNPDRPEEAWPLPAAERAIMRRPGFKVMHIPDIDQNATCQPFTACLRLIRSWSERHPRHTPVFVLLEIARNNDLAGGTPVERMTPHHFDALDSEIRSVFGPAALLVPDALHAQGETLGQAVALHGWPPLEAVRGKIVFLLDQQGDTAAYEAGHAGLKGRIAFPNARPQSDDAAFTEMNDGPAGAVSLLVRRHLLVRVRADADTEEGRSGAIARRDAMLASGAQIVSTDYPDSEPAWWSGYRVGFLSGASLRCNPVTAPLPCPASSPPGASHALGSPPSPSRHSVGLDIASDSMPALVRIVLVMRHGLRTPLPGQEPASVALPGGWPAWTEPPGALTARGRKAMRANGVFLRSWLNRSGLLEGQDCPPPGTIALIANSEPRTIASARSLRDGLVPSCRLSIDHRDSGIADPLFSPRATDPERFDMKSIIPSLPDPDRSSTPLREAIDRLADLVSCSGGPCAFLREPGRVSPDGTGHRMILSGPIQEGSSIAEALMLAYLDGKPLHPLPGGGWLDAHILGRLSALHAAMLDATLRPPPIAAPLSRSLRRRIVQDLLSGEGPALKVYVGHDDTIVPLLGMLDIHVDAPGYARDEIPVGSALGFALYRDRDGNGFVRTLFLSQMPVAMREAPDSAMPSMAFPHVPICGTDPNGCPLRTLTGALGR